MAATSAATFAGGNDETSAQQPAPVMETEAKAPSGGDDLGGGRGEPGRSDARAQEDARTAEEAAIAEYNQQQFLNQIWTSE